MAKVIFINAILSGKLEGTIYARNKAGYYIKGYTMPLDPATSAQQANRSRFSSAASTWHAMTDAAKALWNDYGAQYWVGKYHDGSSPVSGFNAFVSLYNSALFCQARKRVNTVLVPPALVVAFGDYVPTLVAPTGAMSGNIKNHGGGPLPLILTSCSIDAATGVVTSDFRFPFVQTQAPIFQDPVTDDPVGIIIQISNTITQNQEFVSNPILQTVNIIPPPTISSETFTGNHITFEAAGADMGEGGYKTFIQENNIVQASAYLAGQSGAQKPLGSVLLTVT